jgi:hypothetical protein
MPPTILRPQITVKLASGEIVVRDLPWQDSLEFLKRLSVHAKDLFQGAITITAEGKPQVDLAVLLPKLSDLVVNTGELAGFLLTKSTGKDEAWLASLGTIEAVALLDAALEVNLSEGLIELGKKVAGRLARVTPAGLTTSGTPDSPTS